MSKPNVRRRGGISIPRILLFGVLLTILAGACLYVSYTALDFYRDRLLENGSKTLAWLTLQLSFSLPFFIICLFHLLAYHKAPRDGSAAREMFWEVVVVAVLTYAVLLPHLSGISEALYINALAAGESIPKSDGKVEITLLMELHEWFIRLIIPLGVLLAFYGLRARRERLFPETEEAAAPLITVVEFEAQKAAKLAAEQAAREAEAALAAQAAEAAESTENSPADPQISPTKEETIHGC